MSEQVSFDDLFLQLQDSLNRQNGVVESGGDRFAEIQKSIKALPKLATSLDIHNKMPTESSRDTSHAISVADEKKQTRKTSTDAGDKWFNMPKGEIDSASKRDLTLIQQRAALDPKRHYKKEKWQIPEHFQMGTIVGGQTDWHSRLTRKQRGISLTDEILHDDDSKKYFRRKYTEIQDRKTSGKKAHYKKLQEKRRKY